MSADQIGETSVKTMRKSTEFGSAKPGTAGGTFLRQFWQPVYLSSELPAGRAKPIRIMGENFTLYRGQSGVAHVVGNRCPHRSTQLSTGWVKDDCIRCIYHGWTFDGSGQCIERPGENPPEPAPGIRIPAYPTREHLGLIYAFFGPSEPPAFPPFPAFEDEGVVENSAYDFPCNWFQTYENQIDEVHIAFVHSFGGSHNALGRSVQLPDIDVSETNYGMVRHTKSGTGQTRATLYLFPNTMRIIIPPFNDMKEIGGWRDSYLTLVPTTDESHILFMTQLARVARSELVTHKTAWGAFQKRISKYPSIRQVAREVLDGKYTLNDILDHPLLGLIEDAVAQQGQGEIVDRSLERLGRTDVGIVRMRRLFERQLRAITEGIPGKGWHYSGERPALGF
jgi:5,5'-dehydrodivanillate O-demethylase